MVGQRRDETRRVPGQVDRGQVRQHRPLLAQVRRAAASTPAASGRAVARTEVRVAGGAVLDPTEQVGEHALELEAAQLVDQAGGQHDACTSSRPAATSAFIGRRRRSARHSGGADTAGHAQALEQVLQAGLAPGRPAATAPSAVGDPLRAPRRDGPARRAPRPTASARPTTSPSTGCTRTRTTPTSDRREDADEGGVVLQAVGRLVEGGLGLHRRSGYPRAPGGQRTRRPRAAARTGQPTATGRSTCTCW